MVYFEVDFMPNEKTYEDVEVHDMNDMGGSSREGTGTKDVQNNGVPVVWKALSVIIAMMALAYDISPLYLSPDTIIPVLGWLDAVLGWLGDALGWAVLGWLTMPVSLWWLLSTLTSNLQRTSPRCRFAWRNTSSG